MVRVVDEVGFDGVDVVMGVVRCGAGADVVRVGLVCCAVEVGGAAAR